MREVGSEKRGRNVKVGDRGLVYWLERKRGKITREDEKEQEKIRDPYQQRREGR